MWTHDTECNPSAQGVRSSERFTRRRAFSALPMTPVPTLKRVHMVRVCRRNP